MTTITIVDQLLVLLDDEHPHSLDEITLTVEDRSKQTISSTLGRLIAKGWAERATKRGRYQITDRGRGQVTSFLGQIKLIANESWDRSWEQVVFNIPERNRKRRDDLRSLLIRLGYGRLHGWLWLCPWSHRVELEAYIAATRSEKDITILKTGELDQVTNQRIGRLFEWDWTAVTAAYGQFIREAESFLKQRSKRSYPARCLVYQYAKVLAIDPKLPKELPTRVPNAMKAFDLYLKVRPFCYQAE